MRLIVLCPPLLERSGSDLGAFGELGSLRSPFGGEAEERAGSGAVTGSPIQGKARGGEPFWISLRSRRSSAVSTAIFCAFDIALKWWVIESWTGAGSTGSTFSGAGGSHRMDGRTSSKVGSAAAGASGDGGARMSSGGNRGPQEGWMVLHRKMDQYDAVTERF